MNGLINGKLISSAAKHPLVAVVIISLVLLYMVQGMIESQDKRYDKQIERDDKRVEILGGISETLINLNNGQDNLVESMRSLTWEIKQINGK